MIAFSKIICLSIFSFSFLQIAFSQTVSQGAWMAGGSAGFSSSKQEGAGVALTNIEFAPDVGYFIIDDLGLGINVIYSRSSQNTSSFTAFGVGPWVRYYVLENAFAQGGYRYGTSKIKSSGESKTTNHDFDNGME